MSLFFFSFAFFFAVNQKEQGSRKQNGIQRTESMEQSIQRVDIERETLAGSTIRAEARGTKPEQQRRKQEKYRYCGKPYLCHGIALPRDTVYQPCKFYQKAEQSQLGPSRYCGIPRYTVKFLYRGIPTTIFFHTVTALQAARWKARKKKKRSQVDLGQEFSAREKEKTRRVNEMKNQARKRNNE